MNGPQDINLRDLFHKVLTNNSRSTLILTALAMAVWLIGGSMVVMMHYRRLGKSLWTAFSRPEFPFFKFNLKEWAMLALVGLIALYLINSAMSR